MSEMKYTTEKNVQIVISLLKAHGIKRVIASPGTTNMTFVASIQNDPWFEVWSSADERSAAYMACGMAEETGEPVVISCTGATASRNYLPALTEAFYRKLPVLAITSTRGTHKIGHLIDQQIDRRNHPDDVAKISVEIPLVKDIDDEHFCTIEVNKAILALKLNGGGPSHINLYTNYSKDFTITELPYSKPIFRHTINDILPEIPTEGRICVYIGSHRAFTKSQTEALDCFCATHNAIVLSDHTSGYDGKYRCVFQPVLCQKQYKSPLSHVALCIHIGEVSGNYFKMSCDEVWRVSPDGEIRDTFGKLSRVFMMTEEDFFGHYGIKGSDRTEYLDACEEELRGTLSLIPELPFSNIWIAKTISGRFPEKSDIHLGILHSLRSYNFFAFPKGVTSHSNVGGFGIDGCVSTLIGASLSTPQKLYFGIFGDLAFFYDMNALGNRHMGRNVRIILVNNGKGNEFRNYGHPCYFLGDEAEEFIAAAGHYGNKSADLVKHYATDLGFKYFAARSKDEFLAVSDILLAPEIGDRPLLVEVFTNTVDESSALETIQNLVNNADNGIKHKVKNLAKRALGDNTVEMVAGAIRKIKQ